VPIRDLATHPAHYVTVAELAEYWAVSRRQIRRRIESGTLRAICFGKRLYRVSTQQALEFERRAHVVGYCIQELERAGVAEPNRNVDTSMLPGKIGLRPVRDDLKTPTRA
jgi:excisionase family DNA binding protein